MTIAYNWTIKTTKFDVATGFINCAHWNCTATDGDHTASIYSTCGFAAGEPAIPYADVTEADVLEWCWSDGVSKELVEAALANNIKSQKNPVIAIGTPWSA